MKNQKIMFTSVLLALACCCHFAVGDGKTDANSNTDCHTPPTPPGEDRGNDNSAAENVQALNLGTSGSNNTAHVWLSLFSNTSGSSNTADGFQALYSNTKGHDKHSQRLLVRSFSNTTGRENAAYGFGRA